MTKTIDVCLGYNCGEKGSEQLKARLEGIGSSLGYKILKRDCSGHCSKGPMVSVDGDLYSGMTGIFTQSDKKLENFLRNYQAITNIEGNCDKAEGRNCGLAVDIGTTSIKASLVDLETKKVYGSITTINKQNTFGATVLHRWNYFNKSKNKDKNLEHLSTIVQENVKSVVDYFSEKSCADISKVVLAGNSAMTYFFLNKDPKLTLEDKPDYTATQFQDEKIFLPGVFEWVGADIVSGMTYLNFDKCDKTALLIDLGTNGEIALSTKEGAILVAAASAGPAFEGEGFRYGMPAMNGAINEVNSDFTYKVMGGGEPAGLCGSGMLDLIAEMLDNNVMDRSGRINDGKEFFLTDNISVNQDEIDYFKNSKAAIHATIQTIVSEIGLKVDDLDVIYVAGGFGNLNFKKAQRIGLLPKFANYKFAGNTSLKGVQECLDKENLARAEAIAKNSTPLNLVNDNVWINNYQASRFFSRV
tara:strand:- start:135 stop:1547 length:1413 start_codon:yes stop_codon:yes gene_type:complete